MGFSLSQLAPMRGMMIAARMWAFRRLGMDIHRSVRMSLTAKPDLTFPRGIHIGENSYVAFGVRILTHDFTRGLYLHTRIGRHCFIGGDSLVLPGITIADECVVAAGSVVTRDVPPRSVVAGNPARVIRSNIEVGPFGRFLDADQSERNLREIDPEVAALPNALKN